MNDKIRYNHYPTVTKPNRWHLEETEPACRGQQKQLRKQQSVCQFQPEWAEQTSDKYSDKYTRHSRHQANVKCFEQILWAVVVKVKI